jgi:hypothetical protein
MLPATRATVLNRGTGNNEKTSRSAGRLVTLINMYLLPENQANYPRWITPPPITSSPS